MHLTILYCILFFQNALDYKLLPGSNELWPNVASGDPLPAISDCCVIPQWVDSTYTQKTCVPPTPTSSSNCEYWQKIILDAIGLHHPLDGVTNPEYKLLRFIQLTNFFAKRRRYYLLTGIGAAI